MIWKVLGVTFVLVLIIVVEIACFVIAQFIIEEIQDKREKKKEEI